MQGDSRPKLWREPLDLDRVEVPLGQVHIIADRCKGCEFCVEYCPCGVLAMSEEFNRKGYHPPMVVEESGCLACNLCELICPEFAIFTVAVSRPAVKSGEEIPPEVSRP